MRGAQTILLHPYREMSHASTMTYSTLVECCLVSKPSEQFSVGLLRQMSDLQHTETKLLYLPMLTIWFIKQPTLGTSVINATFLGTPTLE